MGVIRAEQIIQDYPSKLEQPWRKAVALRLKLVTRRETDGRQDKEITYVQMAPMFSQEYRHYDKKIGITPRPYVENKLELAPLPAEAKLEPAHGYGSLHHPLEKSPAAKLFIAMFRVDIGKWPELLYAMITYQTIVRRFMQTAKKFYGMTYFHRNQRTQLNLHPNYPEYMEYIRYHVQALMDSIMNQIQGETGREADQVRSQIGEIRQLIRTNEDELHEPDEDGSEDEDEEEDEEPIYFTASPLVISEGVEEAIQN